MELFWVGLFKDVLFWATIFYAIFTLLMGYGWSKGEINTVVSEVPELFFSVVIPVRNEARNIRYLLEDLARQDYRLFEVIVVDDHSNDGTWETLQEISEKVNFPFQAIRSDSEGKSPKKSALNKGISVSKGNFILTTDGDCRLTPGWIAAFAQRAKSTGAFFVSGPVCFSNRPGIFNTLMQVEFASLIASGAASIQLGFPTMCNGANLGFRKTTFHEVGGYSGNDNIASGDDEFLMHKIHEKHRGKVTFLMDENAIVTTGAPNSFVTFFNQRKRWASKWNKYTHWPSLIVAAFIFGFHSLWIAAALYGLFGIVNSQWLIMLFVVRVLADALFMVRPLNFMGLLKQIVFIPLTTFFYSPYVVIIALAASSGSYHWKGRKLT